MTTKQAQETLDKSLFYIRWAGIALFVIATLYFSVAHAFVYDVHVPTSEDFWLEFQEEEHDRMKEEGMIIEDEDGEEHFFCDLIYNEKTHRWVLTKPSKKKKF